MEPEGINLQPVVQPITSPGQTSAPQPPVPPKPKIKLPENSEKYLPFILAFFAILSGILLFFLFQQLTKTPETLPPVTIIVTPTASPTPVRYPTNTSTTSAFLDFETSVNAFAQKLSSFEKSDPSLTPPSLVLPLGFQN